LLLASVKVTVMVEVVTPSAGTELGEAVTVEALALTGPAENTMPLLVAGVKAGPADTVAVNVRVSAFE
jgi:hypothetical protein